MNQHANYIKYYQCTHSGGGQDKMSDDCAQLLLYGPTMRKQSRMSPRVDLGQADLSQLVECGMFQEF